MDSVTGTDNESQLRERISPQHLAYVPGFGGLPTRAYRLVNEIKIIKDPKSVARLLDYARKQAQDKPFGMEYPIQIIQDALSQRLINILFN